MILDINLKTYNFLIGKNKKKNKNQWIYVSDTFFFFIFIFKNRRIQYKRSKKNRWYLNWTWNCIFILDGTGYWSIISQSIFYTDYQMMKCKMSKLRISPVTKQYEIDCTQNNTKKKTVWLKTYQNLHSNFPCFFYINNVLCSNSNRYLLHTLRHLKHYNHLHWDTKKSI